MVTNKQITASEPTENSSEDQETKNEQAKAPEGPSFANLKSLMETSPRIQKMLAEIDAQKLDVKSRLEKLGGMFAAELESFEVEGKVLTAEDAEIKNNLNEFKASIERLFLEEKFRETPVDISRTDRGEKLVDATAKLERGEKLAEGKERERVASILERQNWGKIFTNLKEGDRVLSWEVPGVEFLSIKYLNDKIFGPQQTNEIIAMKRRVVEAEMDRRFHGNVELIQNDYKTEMFRVVKSSEGPKVTQKQLEAAAKVVDEIMMAFVSERANDLLKQERSILESLSKDQPGFENQAKKHQEKIVLVEKFLDDLHGRSDNTKGKEGFQMSWGLSEPIENGDTPEGKLLGIDQSLESSRMAREAETYGVEYSDKKVNRELRTIERLRNKLVGSSMVDKDGNEFKLFTEENGVFVLNKEVLRDVRKGKFVAKDDTKNKDLLRDVTLYVKKLNLLDAVKPFVFEEKDEVLKDAQQRKVLAGKIKAGEDLSEVEKKEAVRLLRSEEKDDRFTSKSRFDELAIGIDKCAYVSLDVLDLGVDLLLEYEGILQNEEFSKAKTDEEKTKIFSRLALEAGDKTTKKLREFRQKVVEICRREEFRDFGFGEDLITAEIGGDELTLAVDTSKISEDQLDQLLFTLKNETNTRVIKTVVSKSEKDVSSEDDDEKKVEAHLQALKRAEKGAEIAKDIEEAVRKLNRLIEREGEEGEVAVREKIGALQDLFVLEVAVIEGVEKLQVKSSVIVVEKDGVFKIGKFKVAQENKREFDYKEISSELDNILGKKAEAA